MGKAWSVLHAEVQIKPVGQLNLEAHPDGIVPLLTGDVQDEPARKTQGGSVGDNMYAGKTNSAFQSIGIYCA